jgi:hypothetical protein
MVCLGHDDRVENAAMTGSGNLGRVSHRDWRPPWTRGDRGD